MSPDVHGSKDQVSLGKGSTMKAALRRGAGRMECVELPVPEPGAGEVLIRVRKVGVCGSDVNRVVERTDRWDTVVLGHELAGEVAALGPGSDAGLAVGDRVTAAPLVPNPDSSWSRRGLYSLGEDYGFVGSRANGAMAEYVVVPRANVLALPPGLPLELGALIEPVTVCLHPLLRLGNLLGASAIVTGAGAIGLLALQALRAMGVRSVIVSDVVDAKLAVARALGADGTVNPARESLRDAAAAFPEGGADVVFESSGSNPAKKDAIACAKGGGAVLLVGTTPQDVSFEAPLFERITRKELRLAGSWMSYSAPFPGPEWTTGLWLLASGRVRSEGLITHRYPLARVADAFDMILGGRETFIKVMLEP
jgi:L-iditol 2-dehydrogenase